MPYIEVDLHMLNSGSEFSSEQYGIIWLNAIFFFIYVYFLLSITISVVREALKHDHVDSPTMGAVLAIYMELLNIIMQTIHLYIYDYNGQGFFILDMLSTVCEMNSQFIISSMLVLIAYGWTITDVDILEDVRYVALGMGVLLVHTMTSFLTAFDDGAHHKYHDYSGFQGIILVTLRIGIYAVFMYGITRTIQTVPSKTQVFLKALAVSGTLYMLAFPILWFASFLFINENYVNRWIVFGNMFIQLFAIIIFLNQLSKKSSKFREANLKKNVL